MHDGIGMLAPGNGKLGGGVRSFSIPAGGTCPGLSRACIGHCYAAGGNFLRESVQAAYARNERLAMRDDFAALAAAEIARLRVRLLRLHVSGDFFDAAYACKWAEAARLRPETRIWAYTRSWRVPSIVPALEELAGLPNVRLWYSGDRDTGSPASLPPGVRLAWMMVEAEEPVPAEAGIVFRVHALRATVVKRVGLAMVCPPENGATGHRTDCVRCRVCWR